MTLAPQQFRYLCCCSFERHLSFFFICGSFRSDPLTEANAHILKVGIFIHAFIILTLHSTSIFLTWTSFRIGFLLTVNILMAWIAENKMCLILIPASHLNRFSLALVRIWVLNTFSFEWKLFIEIDSRATLQYFRKSYWITCKKKSTSYCMRCQNMKRKNTCDDISTIRKLASSDNIYLHHFIRWFDTVFG